MVFATLVVGGVTRLTRSGLSIVEWKPITGIVPPLTDVAWEAAFAHHMNLLPVALLIQIGLGIATLLSVVATPITSAHQAAALVVFTLAVCLEHPLSGEVTAR